ncbi:MAG: LysR family transcriptional regulator [Sphingomonadales bacterium]|nr:LysR family transcriptional regulator [Sphingomonadales bacterium]MDE2172016.1 LysR family transcriptional regulator [Sphingomonadales bacterium]
MKDFLSLRLYARVARLGSISAGARECGLSQSQASRIVAELEASLGARLLSRSTRAVVPTQAGSEFLLRAEAILDAIEDAQNVVREGSELRGLLRISMPSTIGYLEVLPRLTGFTEMHPALRIQVLLEDQRQDLVRDGVDVAIRLGKLTDASATAQLITSLPRVLLASRSYLDKAGAPASPGDLAQHRIIGGPSGAAAWAFERDGEQVDVDLQPHVTVNDNEGAVVAAVAGMGICSTPMGRPRPAVLNGSLVPLLTDWTRPPVEVHAYFPLARQTRIAARSFVAYLKAGLEEPI